MLFVSRRYLKAALCSVIVLGILVLASCGRQSTGPVPAAQMKLGFHVQSPEFASLVMLVTLTMTYPDTIIVDTLPVDAFGEIHDTIPVKPGNSIEFTLRAFGREIEGGRPLLYIGSETRAVAPGQQVEIDILLLPNPELLMLRAGPLAQSVALETDDLVSVYVDIANVDSLFGAAFRIHYDTLVLNFSHAVEGDFLKGTPPEETFSGVLKDTLDFVAYFVTRVGKTSVPVSGVSGSGRLATFFFSKRHAGTTTLTITPRTVSLTRPGPNGLPVNRFSTLVLESATVEVR